MWLLKNIIPPQEKQRFFKCYMYFICPKRYNTVPLLFSQRKRKIRTRLPLGWTGSDFVCLVPVVGLEPTRHRWQRILSPPRLPFQHTGKCWHYNALRLVLQALFARFISLHNLQCSRCKSCKAFSISCRVSIYCVSRSIILVTHPLFCHHLLNLFDSICLFCRCAAVADMVL